MTGVHSIAPERCPPSPSVNPGNSLPYTETGTCI
jgi:hypothetical protein